MIWKFVFPEDEARAGKIAADILRIEISLANVFTCIGTIRVTAKNIKSIETFCCKFRLVQDGTSGKISQQHTTQ
jgi:hypothetical protein